MNMRGFYFVTDHFLSKQGFIADVSAALAAGARMIQYRNKEGASRLLYEEALALRELCKNASLIINDRVDIALAVNADGVHVGQHDLPVPAVREMLGNNKIVGCSVQTIEQALDAQRDGADYLGVGPIFGTTTKSDAGNPLGCEIIRSIKQAVSLPVVAIGGITLENAPRVIEAGADSLCAISAVLQSGDVREEVERFQNLFNKAQKKP